MNEIQTVAYEMLKHFICICEKYHLKYYLVCGSCLGAIKYHGFIPWDDDVDVALPREDYKIFCSVAQAELPRNIFVQNVYTDPNVPILYTKLRDSSTTFVEQNVAHLDMNHGVYIDVFPLDGYPQKHVLWFNIRKKFLKLQLDCVFSNKVRFPTSAYLRLERLFGIHKRSKRTVIKIEKLISKYSTETSSIWCNHGNWQNTLEYAERSQYNDGIEAYFEDLKVVVPGNFDLYLSQKYGDWRADLPEKDKVSHHTAIIIDLENSYRKYNNYGCRSNANDT